MTRSNRFITGLISSYAVIVVNILYTVASVPLALHYLDKEEFGLWALVMQLSGYLILLEFGMTGSVARSLSDHKDNMKDGTYGNILRTGARVFAVQGGMVTLLGLATAWCAPSLLNLPTRLHQPFVVIMGAQALLSGMKLAMGSIASPLWCHQRLDLSNLAASASLVVTFTVLWLGFHAGWHLYSLVISTAAGSLIGLLITYISCRSLGLYPPRECRGRYDSRLFRDLLNFGSSLFLMNVGSQLASASQIIIISRMMGMEAAAVWAISTKMFTLAQQFVSRLLDSSAGGLAEMVVRGESIKLQKRFHDLVSISAVMAVMASATIALTNGALIEIWTSGQITWAPWNNYLLACVLFSTAVTRCHIGLVGITKQIRGMKFVYLIEGLSFISLSVLLVQWLGISGLLIAALICNITITGVYGIKRTASYFGISPALVAGWVARPFGILLITAGLFALTRIPSVVMSKPLFQLLTESVILFIAVIPMLWFIGLNSSLRLEIKLFIFKIVEKSKFKIRPL